jgi:hypothetical protein
MNSFNVHLFALYLSEGIFGLFDDLLFPPVTDVVDAGLDGVWVARG